MPAIPIKYLALALFVIGLVATAYFGWRSYNAAIERAATLQIDLDAKEAELEATKTTYESIVSGMASNETERVRIIERTDTIREEVNAYPVTTQCVDSPAISHVLGRLSDNADHTTED
ncbi:hypothetical protein K7H13_13640 [Qipengyuania citrea]|uniref:hypothetical protein n=1 Tax=Qipengyuania citrea TaxID=225971 RepID=UPI001E547675|nr:hypothetical protein [Qipengyuania citrea]MCD1591791.1 hypothetical protein [Qipengyuania citrea]